MSVYVALDVRMLYDIHCGNANFRVYRGHKRRNIRCISEYYLLTGLSVVHKHVNVIIGRKLSRLIKRLPH